MASRQAGSKSLLWGLSLLFILSLNSAVWAEADEFQVKSAFVYNFLKFVTWKSNPTPEVIKVFFLGDGEFSEHLQAIQGRTIANRPIQVVPITAITEVEDRSVLVISRSSQEKPEEISRFLAGKSVLTIGDSQEERKQSVIFQFFTENEKIRFSIHLGNAQAAGIHIDTRLLKLARIIP